MFTWYILVSVVTADLLHQEIAPNVVFFHRCAAGNTCRRLDLSPGWAERSQEVRAVEVHWFSTQDPLKWTDMWNIRRKIKNWGFVKLHTCTSNVGLNFTWSKQGPCNNRDATLLGFQFCVSMSELGWKFEFQQSKLTMWSYLSASFECFHPDLQSPGVSREIYCRCPHSIKKITSRWNGPYQSKRVEPHTKDYLLNPY